VQDTALDKCNYLYSTVRLTSINVCAGYDTWQAPTSLARHLQSLV